VPPWLYASSVKKKLCCSRNRSKRKALGILFAIILPSSLLQKAFSEIGTLLCLFLSLPILLNTQIYQKVTGLSCKFHGKLGHKISRITGTAPNCFLLHIFPYSEVLEMKLSQMN
jgi:hypothetical protein